MKKIYNRFLGTNFKKYKFFSLVSFDFSALGCSFFFIAFILGLSNYLYYAFYCFLAVYILDVFKEKYFNLVFMFRPGQSPKKYKKKTNDENLELTKSE